jgi:hypothetical protein
MDTAIAGLVGVGVGAVATGGIQAAAAWFDRRLTARSSARLVYMQLHDAQAAIEDLRERRSWENMITDWERYGNEWAKHSVPLARTLKTNKFLNVASAFHCMASLAQARIKDEADPITEGQPSNFNPPTDRLDMYLLQVTVAKRPTLEAAYTWWEKRKGEDRPALAALTKERPSADSRTE